MLVRGQASHWSEASQKDAGPAKLILWLAIRASHNFVQVLSVILYYICLFNLKEMTVDSTNSFKKETIFVMYINAFTPQVRNAASLVHESGFS